MQKKKEKPPILPPDPADTSPDSQVTGEDLRYNEAAGSFELDPETENTDYEHPDPYKTAVDGAADHMSTYDEANPYTPDEYNDRDTSIGDDLELPPED